MLDRAIAAFPNAQFTQAYGMTEPAPIATLLHWNEHIGNGFGGSRQTNTDATKTLTQLRQGVDQAAAGVLGDETAALRRAEEELDQLAQQLDRENGRAAATQAATQMAQAGTQPGRGGERQLAGATQPAGLFIIGYSSRYCESRETGGNEFRIPIAASTAATPLLPK